MLRSAPRLLVAALLMGLLSAAANAQSYLVTTTADSGPGSLRQAILDRNGCTSACPGIVFNIPAASCPTGECVIAPTTPLPSLGGTGGYSIDGATQISFAASYVVIDGNGLPDGLVISAPSVTVNVLSVVGFSGAGVRLTGTADGSKVLSSYLGESFYGVPDPNTTGIAIDSGFTNGEIRNNYIVGNTGAGIQLGTANGDTSLNTVLITQNSIWGNGGLGIDFGTTGTPTTNDPGDADAGVNGLQNWPQITSVTWDGTTFTINGTLDTAPGTYTLEFYGNFDGGLGSEEGESYFLSQSVTVVSGPTPFSVTSPSNFSYFDSITATASRNLSGVPVETSEFSAPHVLPHVAIVTNTNDSGAGSLRDAIAQANSGACLATCTIVFQIPTTDPGYNAAAGTFTILTQFPSLTITASDVSIEGTSQSNFMGFDANPVGPEIVLQGAAFSGAGLTIDGTSSFADYVWIDGLVIRNFGGPGIVVTAAPPFSAWGAVIFDCYIGTDHTGNVPAGNAGAGVVTTGTAEGLEVFGCVIGGNAGPGIAIAGSGGGGNGAILSNRIGIGNTGANVANQNEGVLLSTPYNNVGVYFPPSVDSAATAGAAALKRPATAREARREAMLRTLGERAAPSRRVSGEATSAASRTRLIGRTPATSVTASALDPYSNVIAYNAGYGVRIEGPSAASNVVGNNEIFSNAADGISVAGDAGFSNQLSANHIYSNGGLGIDIAGGTEDAAGVTANDGADTAGPNDLVDHPEILTASSDGANTTITFRYTNAPLTPRLPSWDIELFASTAADPSGFGEGETYLATFMGHPGDGSTQTVVVTGNYGGQWITGTATNNYDSTSEFSAAVLVAASDLSVTKTATPSTVGRGGAVRFDITVTNGGTVGASGVQVVDTLPAGFTWVPPATGAGWNCTVSGSVVTCDRTAGDLPGGSSAILGLDTTAATTAGTYTNTVTVSATNEGITTNNGATATVTVVNGSPVANPDAFTTPEDTPFGTGSIGTVPQGVLLNDTDPDGDPLGVVNVTGPSNGTGTIDAYGRTTYTPPANFNGTATFTYSASDGSAVSSPTTVTITVTPVNDAPTAGPDSATTPADTPATLNVLTNDSDVDGDPLALTSNTNGSNGNAVCSLSGSCTYTPNAGFSGTDSFSYTVSDGAGGTASGTVTITVQPTACPAPVTAVSPASGSEAPQSGFLTWSGGAGADTFSVYLGPAGSGCSTLLGTTSGMSMAYNNLPPGGYEWKVVASKSGCTTPAASACVGFTVTDPCPSEAPDLIAPAPNVEVTPEVTFTWTTVPEALRYHLVIFTTAGGFEELAVLAQPATPLPATLSTTATVPLGTVIWRVVVDYPDSCPSVSSTERLMTVVRDCPDGVPQPIAPLESTSIDATPVLFRWTPVTGAVSYELFLSINGEPFQSAGTLAATTSEPALAAAVPAGATLSWYVAAILPEGCGRATSRTVQVNVSCFPPVLSLQGEVTTDKPYEVRATIVSVGQQYLFEESDTQAFTSVLAAKQGEVDPTGQFVFAMFEHSVTEPRAFFYRVKLAQTGCEFSDVGRIVVIPLPPPTSTDADTVVQFGNEEEVRQPLFIASPTPDRQTSYTYIATTDREWMRVEPPGGTIGQAGVTVTVVTNPVGLPVGTNTGTVTLTFIELAGSGKGALETTPVTGSKPVSVTLVTPVTNKGKGAPTAESLIIPAVAHATGVNSEWQTDVRILNLSAQKQKYRLFWTSTGTDATLSGKNSDLELAPGQSSALDDIVKQWYGLGSMPGEHATGVLEIRPLGAVGAGKDASAVPITRSLSSLASSRTYNKTPQGTLGEYIPAIPFGSFVGGAPPAGGEKSVLSLQQLAQSSSYRTNIGVAEASGQPVNLEMRFYDGEGTKLLTVPVSLRAGEHQQFNQILATNGLTNVTNARAEIEVVSGNGKIAAYASVVDNVTGDPLQVRAVDLATIGARKYVLPGIAHFDTGQARWRSDVQMFNAGLASVTATVSFFPAGATSAAKTATVEIGPGRMRTLADIVPTLFGSSNTGGAIQIATATNSELVITGRTYDQREAGSYGQFMAAVTEEEAIGVGDRAVQVLQMEQSSNIRTNLGLVEVSGKPVRVEITAFPAESRVTPRLEFNLQPNEFRQLNEVLKTLNAGTTYNARVGVRVIGGDGKIVAYGSAVDNLTQDPTFIPGQ